MRRRILTIGQTDIYLHAATLLYAVYVMLFGHWRMVLVGFVSILLHEGAHALTAAMAGQSPEEIEITPMGAVMRLDDEERLPLIRRMLMLAAGPAMTLLLCNLAVWMTARGMMHAADGRMFFVANIGILMMNLMPVLPLDGGRLLSLLLGQFLRGETVRRIMRTLGMLIGLASIVGSVYLAWQTGGWNWSLAAAGCFLMYSASTATTTQAMHELKNLMARKLMLETRGYMTLRRVAVPACTPLQRAVRLLVPRALTEFCLIDKGTLRSVGILTEEQVINRYLSTPQMRCDEVMTMVQATERHGSI
ncbi:MAG: hypothetical protein IJZ74_11640 [Clostridia bacterium]|nr:hypothetical protein [Clostridia bacterium]